MQTLDVTQVSSAAPAAPPGPHRVVIIGGGFGGLYAAQQLGQSTNLQVTLIDKRNFHLFQPLLYQVAMGGSRRGISPPPCGACSVANKTPRC